MNKTVFNSLGSSRYACSTLDSFTLEEIQWNNHYPVHPELVPFKNSIKKILEELDREQNPS